MSELPFRVARARCSELPGATKTFPFDEEIEVWKVRGKMFLMLTRGLLTLKAEPFDAETLRGAHPFITTGWHMNKRHWISVGDGAEPQLVSELVTDSYRLVVAGLPKRLQPVNPETFGS